MTSDPRVKDVGEIKTAHLFDIVIDLNPRLNIGGGPFGQRIVFGAAGGSFEGPRLRGEVLAGGGDWALFRSDGAMTLDVRLTLRTARTASRHGRSRQEISGRSCQLLLPDQSAVRNRGEAIRLAERRRWRRVGVRDRRRDCLQGLSGCLSQAMSIPRRLTAEALGTGFLLIAVVGSGPAFRLRTSLALSLRKSPGQWPRSSCSVGCCRTYAQASAK